MNVLVYLSFQSRGHGEKFSFPIRGVNTAAAGVWDPAATLPDTPEALNELRVLRNNAAIPFLPHVCSFLSIFPFEDLPLEPKGHAKRRHNPYLLCILQIPVLVNCSATPQISRHSIIA